MERSEHHTLCSAAALVCTIQVTKGSSIKTDVMGLYILVS
jgi:hypothetical protein